LWPSWSSGKNTGHASSTSCYQNNTRKSFLNANILEKCKKEVIYAMVCFLVPELRETTFRIARDPGTGCFSLQREDIDQRKWLQLLGSGARGVPGGVLVFHSKGSHFI
jgi:hypothetical protein